MFYKTLKQNKLPMAWLKFGIRMVKLELQNIFQFFQSKKIMFSEHTINTTNC